MVPEHMHIVRHIGGSTDQHYVYEGIHGTPAISPCQTAELGPWLNKHGNIAAVDKELDGNPERNHVFLQHRQALLDMKLKDPKSRVTVKNNPITEMVGISEEKRVGLKAPKVHWMELKSFEKRYGTPKPESLKTQPFVMGWVCAVVLCSLAMC